MLTKLAQGQAGLVLNRIATVAALAGLLALQPTLAQETDQITVDVSGCLELESEVARLACFASEVDAVVEERDAGNSEPPRTVEPTGQRRDIERDIEPATADEADVEESLTRAERRAARRAEKRADEVAPIDQLSTQDVAEGEYFGTIVDIRERLPNAYVITLDNGQIWEQVEPKRFPLRPGLEVRIYPTKWGSRYRLHGLGTGGHIQVQRVK
jgi:hypothetical protein